MADRFVRRLANFVRALDIVDEALLDDVSRFLYDYLRGSLKACYYEVSIEEHNVGQNDSDSVILKTQWCSKRKYIGGWVNTGLKDGQFATQKAYSFNRNQYLWIVSKKENSLLRECETAEGLDVNCGQQVDLPSYKDYADPGEAKTSLLLPLIYEKRVIGIFDVEFPFVVNYSPEVRDHFNVLCDSIATIFGRRRATLRNREDTAQAFSDIRTEIDLGVLRMPKDRPSVFLAYPGKGDPAVIGEVKKTLSEELGDKVKVIDWSEISAPGLITEQVLKAIGESEFGLCYLSEPRQGPDGEYKYQDNANVLFEAGLLHALHHNKGSSLSGWLPIRESTETSGDIPFDFASDRVLIVPRQADESLNTHLFAKDLANHLKPVFPF